MALRRPVPSPATRKAFREGLAEMVRLRRAPQGLPPDPYPQQIYAFGLHQVVKGPDLARARHVAWEFLLGSESGPAVSVFVGHAPRGTPPKMTSIAREPLATQAIRLTLLVEKLPEVQRHNYELRRLRVPALSIGAFWLKSLEGRPDLVVPYEAIARKLKRMQAYPVEEFMSVVRPLAEKRLKFDDTHRH